MNYVIIGFSAAGLAALRTIREKDKQSNITIISEESNLCYSRCLLTYFLSGQIDEKKLFLINEDTIEGLNINVKLGVKVITIESDVKEVVLATGERVPYDKLLIAMGASPILPEKTFQGCSGVYCLRSYDDALLIAREIGKVRRVAVLGDGLVAVTTALALNKRGIEVNLIGSANHLLSQFLDAKAAKLVERKLSEKGISLHPGCTINKCEKENNNQVTIIYLSDGTTLEADMVVVAVGVKPNIDILQNSSILTDRGILVNDYMETSLPGVYAAGDVAQKPKLNSDKAEIVSLWPLAVEEGRIAGLNMTGNRVKYSGALPMNSVNIGELSIIAAGYSNSEGKDFDTYEYLDVTKEEYRRFVFKDNYLMGYILAGNTEKAGILSALIREQQDISTFKEELCYGQINYPILSLEA